MAEENIIIIDDDTDDDYDYWMDPVVAERMEIEREERERREMEDDGSDIEIEPLEKDSDYDSDNSDDILDELLQKKQRNLSIPEIITINEATKICISYYYMENGSKYCTECFLGVPYQFEETSSVREHRTIACINMDNMSCKGCKKCLNQILRCNMCPICTN